MRKRISSENTFYYRATGGVIPEFVIIIPVILMLVFSFIDFARFYYYQGLATTSAQQGISLAQVIAGLEDLRLDSTGQPDPSEPIIEAINERAVDLISTRMGVPVKPYGSDTEVYIIDPARPNSGQFIPTVTLPDTIIIKRDLEEALKQDPIVIDFQLYVKPISPWLPAKTFNITSAGFRELGPEPANPPAMDCHGNVITDPNAPLPTNCPCPGDEIAPIIRNTAGVCICLPTGQVVVNPEDCVCPAPQFYDPTQKRCVCPSCPPGQSQSANCACSCPPCSTMNNTNNTCQCNTETCSISQSRHGCCCRACPGLTQNQNGDATCEHCPYTAATAQQACPNANQIFNPTLCRCETCPNFQTSPNGLTCGCPEDFINSASTHCRDDQRIDVNACRCEDCPAGKIRNPRNPEQCICPNPISKRKCEESGGATWNSDTCTCEPCDLNVKSIIDGQCVCDYNKAGYCKKYGNHRWIPRRNCCAPCLGYSYVSDDLKSCICPVSREELLDKCTAQGLQPDRPACRCIPCPNPNHIFNGTACRCPNDCASNQQQQDDCSCEDLECPPHFELGDDGCICTRNCEIGTVDPNSCVCIGCPTGYITDPTTGECVYDDNGEPPE